jgi:hypothetical protein
MSTGEPQSPHRTPPVGEEIHMPGPSLLPIITAAAITVIVIGTTIHFIFSGLIFSLVGLVVLIICVYLWITSTARDVASLPDEHKH